MVSGSELSTYCDRLEKIGYKIGRHSFNEEQIEELKKAYEKGLSSGKEDYEESAKIINDRDLDDFVNS